MSFVPVYEVNSSSPSGWRLVLVQGAGLAKHAMVRAVDLPSQKVLGTEPLGSESALTEFLERLVRKEARPVRIEVDRGLVAPLSQEMGYGSGNRHTVSTDEKT